METDGLGFQIFNAVNDADYDSALAEADLDEQWNQRALNGSALAAQQEV